MVTLLNVHIRHTKATDRLPHGRPQFEGRNTWLCSTNNRTPVIGQILDVQAENTNGHDRYTASTGKHVRNLR